MIIFIAIVLQTFVVLFAHSAIVTRRLSTTEAKLRCMLRRASLVATALAILLQASMIALLVWGTK